jgi:hypothetical protein
MEFRCRNGTWQAISRALRERSFAVSGRPISPYRLNVCKQLRQQQLIRLQHTQRHVQKSTKLQREPHKSSLESRELRAVERLDELLRDASQQAESNVVPSETTVLESLKTCWDLAEYFKSASDPQNPTTETEGTPASALLFLDENEDPLSKSSSKLAKSVAKDIKEQAVNKLSSTAYNIIKNPFVFITPQILEAYVQIQSLLGRPETLSQVFHLFANKPIPVANSSPVRFLKAKPNNPSSAVPDKVADNAMDAAIEAKNLPLCLDIIGTTVCAPAFRRAKFIRKALLPLTGLSLAPFAAYAVASQISVYQNTMSPEMATNIAFAGITAYVGLTAVTGVIAVTTANDQMDRVTWATGMPLRERWLREEERAMIDKVAGAWGFKEPWRRGDESGEDWAALKEFTGLRGMVLDKTSLMEGME